jgi:hypothetical protein
LKGQALLELFPIFFLWEKVFFLASLKNPPLAFFFSEAKKRWEKVGT